MKNKRDHFLSEVTNHIRSKEAKQFVASELDFHLNEVKKEWVGKGLSEEEAEERAVSQMGSPAKLGADMNKLHKPKIDWWLIGLLVITMGLSFLPVISLDHPMADILFVNKMIHVALGLIVVAVMMFLDYRRLERLRWTFYLIGNGILFALVKFATEMINGVSIIRIGAHKFDSFMALPFLFLAWASFFNHAKLKVWHQLLLFALPVLLFMGVPNITGIFIYIIMVFVMMWWSRISKKTLKWITAVSAVSVFSFIGMALFTAKPYQLARIWGFLYPEESPSTWGYMYLRLKEKLSAAGWFGSFGERAPLAKEHSVFLVEEHTDLVFAGLTYQYGYLFAIVLLLILSLFAARMYMITTNVNTHYGKLLLVGGITLYLVQFVYNIGMIVGLLPITSISLPFISYGFTQLLFNAFIMGIVLSVYRRKDLISNRVVG
ncbi:FtsW/RodA/SpoVE family cell cycle protein [Mesobacillus subterraneus]|uniref:FtsW/RodA/SpoVE family cell cycle protein n=1 Tax=Mesobacillus subterraneus TaxID=285983 RepID=A0A427TW33_9BACI|nr:FtsW/RodA/SpoVE family cell cycle protein [Mesobacillus subterraneus]RSD28698.1 FtsW/RodA/SpoVE family cell cycle protein [Mesobacillus subterraneus]